MYIITIIISGYLLFSSLLLASYIDFKRHRNELEYVSILFSLFSFAIIFLLIVPYTPDYENYRYIYNSAPNSFSIQNFLTIRREPLFLFICTIFKKMEFSYYVFRAFFGIFSLFFAIMIAHLYVNEVRLYLLMFFGGPFLIGIIGQPMSGFIYGFLPLLITLTEKKCYFKYFFLIIFLSMFHIVALLYTLLFLIKNIRIRYHYIIAGVLFSLLMYFLLPNLLNILNKAIDFPVFFRYVNHGNNISFFSLGFIRRFCLILVLLHIVLRKKSISKYFNVVGWCVLSSFVFYTSFMFNNVYAERFTSVFVTSEFLLLLFWLNFEKYSLSKYAVLGMIYTFVFAYSLGKFNIYLSNKFF